MISAQLCYWRQPAASQMPDCATMEVLKIYFQTPSK